MRPTPSQPSNAYPKSLLIAVVVAILLLSINMRSPIIGFGAVATWIQQDLQLSTQVIGLIGTIPVMAFAFSSFIVPTVARKIGLENTLVMASTMLALGIFGRSWLPNLSLLLFGTVLLSLAIAFGNVLVPAVIKKYLPNHISQVMGMYSLMLSVFAGLSAGVANRLVAWRDWQFALSVWGWVSVLALMGWLWVSHQHTRQKLAINDSELRNQAIAMSEPSSTRSVWRMPMAWWISGYMGLQSLLYYTLASFLPSLLHAKGLSDSQVGQVGMVFQLMAFPSIMLLTKWVGAGWHLRTLGVSAGVGNLLGVIGFGLLPANGLIWLWAVCAGFGCGVIFTLCMMMFTLKAKNSQQTAELSGMAQTVGYSIAVTGPLLTGWLRDISYGWTLPMTVLTGLMGLLCVFAWFATADKPIE
ncbi:MULTISPECIES: CynX/NimT family MFS transporter [unclassified Moraxella]|uniref:MFS transporter n=1 Tax=unclassified Moraxella TaxID=2685852 RepID=UPI003AF5FB29